MRLVTWWRGRSQAARFDLYVRASFYVNLAVMPVLAAVALAPDIGSAAWLALVLFGVPAACCALLVRTGLNSYIARGPRPYPLVAATTAVTAAAAAVGYLAYPEVSPGQPDGPANATMIILVTCLVMSLSAAVRPRVTFAAILLSCVAVYALTVAQGRPNVLAVITLVSVLAVVSVAGGVSAWMLGVVWELDRARHVQASLAVAEERLRFARDLHDVVGRTLSVIALKSELAAQLARRGRETAIDEMLEVRRVAHESLDELRAVIGGYRAADLDAELAGARSLLASAGIECRMIGDGSGLPPPVQSTLGWAVREGTTNVLRHSDATTCTITLRVTPTGDVTLTMENDGTRPDAAAPVRFGSGLVGLAERLSALNGTVTAERHNAARFRLCATLPPAGAPPRSPASSPPAAGSSSSPAPSPRSSSAGSSLPLAAAPPSQSAATEGLA